MSANEIPKVFDATCTTQSSETGQITNTTTQPDIKEVTYNYMWKLQNFRALMDLYPNKEMLRSDEFCIMVAKETSFKFCVRVYPRGTVEKSKAYVSVFLDAMCDDDVKISNDISIIDANGMRTHVHCIGEYTPKYKSYGYPNFITHTNLLADDANYLKDGHLTLAFKITIKAKVNNSNKPSIIKEDRMKNWKEMFNRAEEHFGDVTIKCTDGEVICHTVILSAVSPHYKSMLTTPMQEGITKIIPMKRTKATCLTILEFLYTGEVAADKITHEVYEEVDKLEMEDFFRQCSKQLMKDLDEGNCIATLMVAFLHEDKPLMEAAAKFILENLRDDKVLKEKLVGEYSPLSFYLLDKARAKIELFKSAL